MKNIKKKKKRKKIDFVSQPKSHVKNKRSSICHLEIFKFPVAQKTGNIKIRTWYYDYFSKLSNLEQL